MRLRGVVEQVRRPRNLIIAAAVAVLAAFAIVSFLLRHRPLTELTGVVLQQDRDPAKQPPIKGAEVFLSGGLSQGSAWSDAAGLFHLKLRPGVRIGQSATLIVRHQDYIAARILEILQDRLYVIRVVPAPSHISNPQILTDLKIRYTVRSTRTEDVSSAMKRFEVVNQGDVPCRDRFPCSPDGKWKATIGRVTLDAVEGSEFHNARVTCIAGPCPFTRIEKDGFSAGGRSISVAVRDWSDTVSFVLEADVTRSVTSETVRQAFPVLFNQVLSFTLPASAQGTTIEATLDGMDIVYPLGPALELSWADCSVTVTKNDVKLVRCTLKPGYQFPESKPLAVDAAKH
jgi:hypothetical protein